MEDERARTIVAAVFARFEQAVRARAGRVVIGSQMEQVIDRTLESMRKDLHSDPAWLTDIIRQASRLPSDETSTAQTTPSSSPSLPSASSAGKPPV
jgi:hypothetical protein